MEKKTIVITGSTRGIGLGLAKELSLLGHQLIINGRTEEKVSQIITEMQKINPAIIGVAGNVTIEKTHNKLIEQTHATFGKLDIWINNAGIPQPYKLFTDLDREDIQNLINTNILGLLLGTKAAASYMLNQGYGKIFNMEGFGSQGRTMNKLTLYGTTKRAVHYFTKSYSKEIRNSPIQIGILSPGMVRTDFLEMPMLSSSPEELMRFNKVSGILANDVDVVSRYLVKRILLSKRNYDRIEYLTKIKTSVRMIKLLFK